MKKHLLTLLCITFLFSANAQQYHPMLDSANLWNYTGNEIPVKPQNAPVHYAPCSYPLYNFSAEWNEFTSGDTIIRSTLYKQVLTSDTCLIGFLREDTAARKVYFQDVVDSPEVLLYDFSMAVGDSILVKFLAEGFFQSGYYTLDSITTVNISAGSRRMFHLNCHTCLYSNTLSWLESVGNLGELLYPYSANTSGELFKFMLYCSGNQHDFYKFIICFSHNQKVYYDTCAYAAVVGNSCFDVLDTYDYFNICGGIKESGSFFDVQLFPNPAAESLNVKLKSSSRKETAVIRVRNIMGQEIYQSSMQASSGSLSRQSEMNVSPLSPGIYFMEIIGETGRWVGRFVKE